jgi:hypothetical protein
MIDVKGIVRRSHSNWLRTAKRNSRSMLAKIPVPVSPFSPKVLMKDRRTGLRSRSPRPSPLLVTITSTHTNPKAANRSVKSKTECKPSPHKPANNQPQLPRAPKNSSPNPKRTQPNPKRHRFRGPQKCSPPPSLRLKRARERARTLMVWYGDSTKPILASHKHTGKRPLSSHHAFLSTNKETLSRCIPNPQLHMKLQRPQNLPKRIL